MLRTNSSGMTDQSWVMAFVQCLGERILPLATGLSMLTLVQFPAIAEVTIAPNFSPNPLELRGHVGGTVSVTDVVSQTDTPTGPCTGFTHAKPNHTLVLTGFFNSLSLRVHSAEDTALVIEGPGGVWCNDDSQGKNPGISGQWLAGTYKIWVTSYSKNSAAPYTLRIREKR